ncbi:MAG: dihydroorotate dehydrogenase electron transfer subunit [Oscillospiraceae bacterium]|jgi:dihydroorotate dehydrogenase electron transfer subunit|nr:dihydroorotate dehydrogenase electron transfer subunit [Oscillospiraceae bacterium]
MQQVLCRVVRRAQLADDVVALAFESAELARTARAGQFIGVKCGENLLRRPISICDVTGDELTIVFALKGAGTQFLAERKVGDVLDVLGTLGNGFDIPEGEILVVGGGIGSPPLLSAAKTAQTESVNDVATSRVTAILGFRSKPNVILAREFATVCREVYITTDDGTFGRHGTVAAPLEELLSARKFAAVLACGPRPMLRAVAEVAERHGVTCQVSLEERMACGVGACLVCVCATRKDGEIANRRVCRDGPVLDSREVIL